MDAEVRYKDRYPLVRPRSSLLTYLELCKPGAEIDFWWLSGKEEEAVLARKLDDHTWWVGDPGEDVQSYTLVGMLRTYVEGACSALSLAAEPHSLRLRPEIDWVVSEVARC